MKSCWSRIKDREFALAVKKSLMHKNEQKIGEISQL